MNANNPTREDAVTIIDEKTGALVAHAPSLKGGTTVLCSDRAQVAQVQGMDRFAQWLRTDVLGEGPE